MSNETKKRYLIWSYPDGSDMGLATGDDFHFFGIEDWLLSAKRLPACAATGRFVTLDHQPTPSEVRELLAGPDPLEECLELLDYFMPGGPADESDDGTWAEKLDRGQSLINKYKVTA